MIRTKSDSISNVSNYFYDIFNWIHSNKTYIQKHTDITKSDWVQRWIQIRNIKYTQNEKNKPKMHLGHVLCDIE